MRYAFIFVCQEGEIEIQAMLLAASLVQHLRCEYELIAALPVPEGRWGAPARETLKFLRRLGVQLVPICNRITPQYPIGNKVSCLYVETLADKLVFLDSDILMLQDFLDDPRFQVDFNAKTADLATFSRSLQLWRRVYSCMGLAVPPLRVSATESAERMPPYFNSGVIAVAPDTGLGEAWVACCRTIDRVLDIPRKRPWLDQIALPVAVTLCGLSVDLLGRKFNYPAHIRPVETDRLPIFCHYHRPEVIARQRPVFRAFRALCQTYPALSRSMWRSEGFSHLLAEAGI